MILQNGLFKAQ